MGEIIMPKVGDAMTEGKVVRWYKKEGDPVKTGEPILEIETDKVNLDLEAEEDGILDQVEAGEGKVVEVGGRLAMLRTNGEPASPGKKKEAKAPPKATAESEPPLPEEKARATVQEERRPLPVVSVSAIAGSRVRSSPLARRMAREMGVDLSSVRGSGPGGRVVASDVSSAAKSGPAAKEPASVERPRSVPDRPRSIEQRDVPLTAMRKTIARRLVESIGPVPHFFLTIDADVTSLLDLRKQLNEIERSKVSINDFIVRASALAILHHPYVNSSFGDDAIHQHGDIHVGIAVATPEGLITPVVRNADRKSVLDIATETREMADRARNRRLKPEEYQGATFTISNLGMFGIEEFTAIINPPNAAILAVGAAMGRPVAVDRHVVVRDRMKVTMSCDHRVIDGAAGAQFLQTLQQYLEQPLRLLI